MQDRDIEQCSCHCATCEENDDQAGEQLSEVNRYVLIKVKENVT